MWLVTLSAAAGILACTALAVQAADLEMKTVDKDCTVEIFDDTKYDPDDPHVTLQGPKEFASLKELGGRNWNNDIQSLIVGQNATVHAYKERDFKGTEIVFTRGQRVPDLSKLNMSNDIESMKISCDGQ
ncbi:MAG TPA: beta/gamma crystallin domain-containing protein [Nitrospira sp.]